MEQHAILGGLFAEKSHDATQASIDGFLASVEKKAFVMSLAACQNQDAALDIVQDTMLSMVKNYKNRPSEQWAALFFKVLNNRIVDHHRKRGFGRLTQWLGINSNEPDAAEEAVDQLDSEVFGPDVFVDALEVNSAVQSALARLSSKQQQALVLRLWQGLSVKETALAMNVSEGSVKTHLSRAVHEMRDLLSEYKPT
ncbi:MAG: RNA polymerase sigma-70 factor (ECF subfamily) [Granulosicoccus sp.]|jgi:RNA polymerase sigma-70 factor (ECF subfamily)